MKCKQTLAKVLLGFILGSIAISFSFDSMDAAVEHNKVKQVWSCIPSPSLDSPSEMVNSSYNLQISTSEPLESLFRVLFILFIISPPIIVILLVLIWRELRAKNKMK